MPELWVLDTHIWIRLLNGDPVLNRPRFLEALNDVSRGQGLRIAAISLWETAKLAAKGRLKLTSPERDWLEAAQKMPGLAVVALSAEIATDSCFLPGTFHGDPADRLITATARCTGAWVITLDEAILDYGNAAWVRARSPLEYS